MAAAYPLGKRVRPAWIGFLVAVAWLPLLLLGVPPGDRATAFGVLLWSLVPILIGFRWGRADR